VKEAVKEIQRALISADVEVSLVLELSKKIESKAFGELPKGITRREFIIKLTYDSLVELLGGSESKVPEKPKKILLLGLFGSGKTTSSCKIAKYYMKRGLKAGVICADSFRPAAFEQLKQLCEKIQCEFYGNPKEKKAQRIVQEGLKKFQKQDLVIVDSAGRSALDTALVQEIQEIQKELQAEETWLVIGADMGQLAKKQAKAFHEAVGVNGIIITRMDGSAKGGGSLAACHATKAPVYFIGVGEKIDDLEVFEAERFLSRVMGFGDLQALLEKAKEAQEEGTELSMEELLQGEFNLKTFYEQLKAAKKIGPLGKIAEMMGLNMQVPKEMLETGEEKLEGYKIMMDSMTKAEMNNPELLNKSRIERVAKGAGRKEKDVRELIRQFRQMKQMFKQFKKLGDIQSPEDLKKGKFAKMMQKFAQQKKQKMKIR
jgi:signal recognition particle subunit SRP54